MEETVGNDEGASVGDFVAVPGTLDVGARVGAFGKTGKKVGLNVGSKVG
jgi:hypothetical protein